MCEVDLLRAMVSTFSETLLSLLGVVWVIICRQYGWVLHHPWGPTKWLLGPHSRFMGPLKALMLPYVRG